MHYWHVNATIRHQRFQMPAIFFFTYLWGLNHLFRLLLRGIFSNNLVRGWVRYLPGKSSNTSSSHKHTTHTEFPFKNPHEIMINLEKSPKNPQKILKESPMNPQRIPREAPQNPEESLYSPEESPQNPEESPQNPEEFLKNLHRILKNLHRILKKPHRILKNPYIVLKNLPESWRSPRESPENPQRIPKEPPKNLQRTPRESSDNPEDLSNRSFNINAIFHIFDWKIGAYYAGHLQKQPRLSSDIIRADANFNLLQTDTSPLIKDYDQLTYRSNREKFKKGHILSSHFIP